jgi:hypothetical protein
MARRGKPHADRYGRLVRQNRTNRRISLKV